jgi:hypothetical protein
MFPWEARAKLTGTLEIDCFPTPKDLPGFLPFSARSRRCDERSVEGQNVSLVTARATLARSQP